MEKLDGEINKEIVIEDFLHTNIHALALGLTCVGRQVDMDAGLQDGAARGLSADLLALNRKGRLCIIEIKRDQADMEVLNQILGYATRLGEHLPHDLDALIWRFTGKSLADTFVEQFHKPLPEKRDPRPMLVIVADSFDPDFADTVCFMNHHYRLDLHLFTYASAEVARAKRKRGGAESAPKTQLAFHQLVTPKDAWLYRGKAPKQPLFLRLDEADGFRWSDFQESQCVVVRQADVALVEASLAAGGPSLLVFLHQTGYVGLAAPRPGAGAVSCPVPEGWQAIPVTWEVTLDREHAWQVPATRQPERGVHRLPDESLWRLAAARLPLLAKRRHRGATGRTKKPGPVQNGTSSPAAGVGATDAGKSKLGEARVDSDGQVGRS